MTKERFRELYKELMSAFDEILVAEAEHLIRSGGIDLERYGDNYAAPKVVLTAALHRAKNHFAPIIDSPAKRDCENLKQM